MADHSFILTVNGGSSSLKLAVFRRSAKPTPVIRAKIDGAHSAVEIVRFDDRGGRHTASPLECSSRQSVEHAFIEWLMHQYEGPRIAMLAHRIVHGMSLSEPQFITATLIEQLRSLQAFDPEHLPRELELIDTFGKAWPAARQMVCFDTAFHRHLPRVARQLPIPRKYFEQGVRRYGFHGLSYQFLCERLKFLEDPAIERGRVVLAHLGSGASVAAVLDGRSIDTSMAFTPTSGMPMSTRSGDLDAGLVAYLWRQEHLSVEQYSKMINQESGLLGISGTSGDVRELLAHERDDADAAAAIESFCYRCRQSIAAMAAALRGIDALVFAGGIGERAPAIRARICEGLEFLGLELDEQSNTSGSERIGAAASRVRIYVVETDEEYIMANEASRLCPMK